MDNDLFLQHLRELRLEEGKAYIQEHIQELTDHAAIGELLAEEALDQLYTNPSVSLKLSELLIFFSDYTHYAPSHALGLKAKGDALKGLGHHQGALEALDAAGEEFLHMGDEMNWARTRIAWIISAAWLGHAKEALHEATRAHEVFLRYGEDYWACVVDHNTALIYTRLGQYQAALSVYNRILATYPTLSNPGETVIQRAIAMAEGNQAINLFFLGNFEQAFHLHQQVQAKFIALKETSASVKAEMHLAEIDSAQGYYGSALRRYYQARDSFKQNKLNDPYMLTEILQRMAACLVKLNRTQEACQLAAEAVKISRQLGISLDTGSALHEYATTLVVSGRLEEALSALDEAWTIFSRGGFDHYASTTKLQKAELLLLTGATAAAYDEARLIKKYFDSKSLVSRSVRASLVMANALVESAQQAGIRGVKEQQFQLLQEAESLCKQSTSQAHQHNLQEEVYKGQYLLGRLAALQGNPGKAARYYRIAIAQVERILDDLVYDLSPSFLRSTWAAYEDMIALCIQQSQVERAFSYLERVRSVVLRQYLNKSKRPLDEKREQEASTAISALQENRTALLQIQHQLGVWQQEYRNYSTQLATLDFSVSPSVNREVIQNELKRCEEQISELFERLHLHQAVTHSKDAMHQSHTRKRKARKTKSVDIAQLRQYLTSDQLLLTYFLYQGRLIIFAATTVRLVVHENPDGAVQLERLLPLLHAHLQPGGWPDIQRPPQQVIRRLLNRLYNLLVAPVASLLPSSGYLTIVPYGPLHELPFHALYNGSRFLIEDFQINYLPAASILTHFVTRRSEQNGRPTNTKMPTKPPLVFGYSGNGHLQRVLDEAKTIATLLDGQCYLEGEATITRLIERAPGSPIIHLATHGQSRLDAPNFSYVRLADGQLNAIDAFSLNLEQCELVTLSGCETGLALSGGGDEQLGLGRAFLAAGASSLVMSLWPVEDNATNELMQLFYQHLLKGETKVQSLRATQCSLLRQASPTYTHPYFWASFRLVGDVGPLNRGRTQS